MCVREKTIPNERHKNAFMESFSGVHLKVFAFSIVRAKRTGVEKDKRGYKEFICAADTNEIEWSKEFTKDLFRL